MREAQQQRHSSEMQRERRSERGAAAKRARCNIKRRSSERHSSESGAAGEETG